VLPVRCLSSLPPFDLSLLVRSISTDSSFRGSSSSTKETMHQEKEGKPDHQQRLFVYGSLRPDVNIEMHRKFMPSCSLIGDADFQGLMYAIDHAQDIKSSEELTHYQEGVAKYPGVVESDDPSHKVKGMLFSLSSDRDQVEWLLRQLDIYEGTAEYVSRLETAEYERKMVRVYVPSLEKYLETWIYLWRLPVSKLDVIARGDYVLYQNTSA